MIDEMTNMQEEIIELTAEVGVLRAFVAKVAKLAGKDLLTDYDARVLATFYIEQAVGLAANVTSEEPQASHECHHCGGTGCSDWATHASCDDCLGTGDSRAIACPICDGCGCVACQNNGWIIYNVDHGQKSEPKFKVGDIVTDGRHTGIVSYILGRGSRSGMWQYKVKWSGGFDSIFDSFEHELERA